MRERFGVLLERVRSFDGFGVLVLAVLASALSVPKFGEYVNRAGFFEPFMIVRSKLGLAPKVSTKIALVVVDDRSLQVLQRMPQLADWQQVAALLATRGIQKTLLLDSPHLASELGALGPRDPRTAMFGAAVAIDRKINARTVAVDKVPERLLLMPYGAVGSAGGAAIGLGAPFILPPAPASFDVLSALGDVSPPAAHLVKLGVPLANGGVLPALALYAARDLKFAHGVLREGDRVFPTSEDGEVYVDYPDFSEVLSRAVSVTSFFDSQGAHPRAALEPQTAAKLDGAEIALLVPNGFSGARFVDAPERKVPSYAVTVALVNSVVAGEFLHRPIAFAWFDALLAGLLVAVFVSSPARRALLACAGLGILTIGGAALALAKLGWVLPASHAGVLLGATVALVSGRHLLQAVRQRLRLERDLELGQTVQNVLLPKRREGRLGPWLYRISFKPYGPMSGDWFQIAETPAGAPRPMAIIAIGDVVGKGPSAALITSAIAALWQQHEDRWQAGALELGEWCRLLNRVLHRTFHGTQNTTLSIVLLTETELWIASAASPHWMSLSNETRKAVDLRLTACNPVGMMANLDTLEVRRIAAKETDLLVVFTDGVIDGSKGRNLLRRAMLELTPESPDYMAAIEAAATAAGAADTLPDDATILAIRRVA